MTSTKLKCILGITVLIIIDVRRLSIYPDYHIQYRLVSVESMHARTHTHTHTHTHFFFSSPGPLRFHASNPARDLLGVLWHSAG